MSYRCDSCNEVRMGKELVRVSKLRDVTYNRVFTRINRRDRRAENVFDESFYGTEAVRTDRLCAACYDNLKDVPPTVTETKTVEFVGTKRKSQDEVSSRDEDIDPKEKF